MPFFARLKLALRILFGGQVPESKSLPPPPVQAALPPPAPPPTPEQTHASALFLLGLLQREGRLLDFLGEDLASYSDGDVGAAARLVHDGCRKTLAQYVPVEPIVAKAEGDSVSVPTGFDANRWRLVGNVSGPGPWTGALKHHGWVATTVTLPALPTSVDLRVLAAAEVELP